MSNQWQVGMVPTGKNIKQVHFAKSWWPFCVCEYIFVVCCIHSQDKFSANSTIVSANNVEAVACVNTLETCLILLYLAQLYTWIPGKTDMIFILEYNIILLCQFNNSPYCIHFIPQFATMNIWWFWLSVCKLLTILQQENCSSDNASEWTLNLPTSITSIQLHSSSQNCSINVIPLEICSKNP